MTGQAVPQRLVAGGQRLWLIYDKGIVQSVRVDENVVPDQWSYRGPKTEASLPPGVVVRAAAANDSGLWVLVRVSDANALTQIDTPQPNKGARRRGSNKNARPSTPQDKTPTTNDQTTDGQPNAQVSKVPLDRLLHQGRKRWTKINLPKTWLDGAPCWMTVGDAKVARPTLVMLPSATGGSGNIE